MATKRLGPQWRILLLALLALASAEDLLSEPVKSSRLKSRTHTRLEMSTEFFIIPSRNHKSTTAAPDPNTNTAAVVVVTRKTPVCAPGQSKGDAPCVPSVHQFRNRTLNPSFTPLNAPSLLRREGWVIPLLIFSALTMLLIAGFEVFVLCKAWRTSPSRRHLFLGQMLLLGLFLCAGLGGVVAVSPNVTSCATVRFGVGLSFAIVFSTLLVKNVFLISLNSGVYLPAPYQALLLLFAVLIQLVVDVQWLVNSPPKVDALKLGEGLSSLHRRKLVVTADDLLLDLSGSVSVCHTPYTEILMSLLYVVFLIVFVAILAIKSRGIRDNYREATYIGLSVGCVIPMWMIWAVTGLVLSERHKDACIGFGLVSTSAVIFLIMFMPKGRQLAAMGKDGVYVEDREDRFSSLTPAGSGYSPSFFHFKPVKYGVVGENVAPTLTTHKTNPSAVTTVGDRMALVAAPPSYTRMYHYFPPTPYYPSFYPPRYPDKEHKLPRTGQGGGREGPTDQPPAFGPQPTRSLSASTVRAVRRVKLSGPGPVRPLPVPLAKIHLASFFPPRHRIEHSSNIRGVASEICSKSEEGNFYSSRQPTLSSNPNVFFQRNGIHPGMMY